jgi:RepB DNA-primase C-terminal helical domain
MFGCNSIKEVYFWTATNRRLSGASWSIIAPPFILRLLQRFPHPDWSIADKWIAKELLRQGVCVTAVAALLREGSPGFPRGHGNPEDYLRRTLARALGELHGPAFPALQAPCVPYAAR